MDTSPEKPCSTLSIRGKFVGYRNEIPRSRLWSVQQRLGNDCEGTRRGLYLALNLIGVTIATDEVGLPHFFSCLGIF